MEPIRRAAVIGAGVMGAGIAAHFANAGVSVLLLDIVPPNLTDAEKKVKANRNRFAAGGLEKALKSKPAAFFHKSNARLVETGNTEDDLERVKDCDLVIEAIIEKLEAKQSLFEKLEKLVKPGAVVASNTSGLRIVDMLKGRGDAFRKNFLVMHFFNPVRYMKLLELVLGPETSTETADRIRTFGETSLGKGIVFGKDTPNFVGNRIGIHAMMTAIHGMVDEKLAPEDVDAITGTPMGHPKSASFRTADMVGLDTFCHVADNCYQSLPTDEERDVFKVPAYIRTMVEKKLLGDKTKSGFYRKSKEGVETLDPYTGAYRAKGGNDAIKAATKVLFKIEDTNERLKKLFTDTSPAGAFGWKVASKSLAYSARRIGEIADDVTAIDDAMKWGYNWELGPFETWDAMGFTDVTDRMVKDGIALPPFVTKMRSSGITSFYRKDGAVYDPKSGEYKARKVDPRNVTLAQMRKGSAVLNNDGGEAWDLGDGILGVTFKTKANSIDPDVISLLHQSVERAERDFQGILVFNQGEHFCVGANLLLVLMAAAANEWGQVRQIVEQYQAATQKMKYARVPVVVAPYGMTLGGGLELCLGADAVQASCETYTGLVEVGVGLIPGGAGTLNLLWRALESQPEGAAISTQELVTQVFKNIALAKIATSAPEAKAFGYFRTTDGITMDRARQLHEAKARVVGMANAGYLPPTPKAYVLPGESGIATLRMMVDTLVAGGYASEHDAKIATKLAGVLCGGVGGASREVTEKEVLELEAEAFVSLAGEPKSLERMQFMLQNNKPLRN
ncbi:MAG: 3-hydroxyacyl-CoA dehydrogenase/enoyl-CoA hydratase family protein [Polyangiaceae bacterium]|nr:3-hydroxyacyl-CoA dehydrogenase/enoyl-CoA hydratase family protein [Polyangiaceae bacterium]